MHYVTFRIKETKNGEFVLYLHNHAQEKVFEQLRSRNLDEIIDKLKKGLEYRKRFMNAMGNYAPVVGFMDKLEARFPDAGAEAFPDGWTDPLELYGQYRQELMKRGADLERERADLQELLGKHSPEWVWQYRLKLVAERVFMRDFCWKAIGGAAHRAYRLVLNCAGGLMGPESMVGGGAGVAHPGGMEGWSEILF